MNQIVGRPAGNRESVHPTITPNQISDLVDQFYDRVLVNPRLSPVFEKHVTGDWQEHLKKMKSFWRSVLLKTGEYKGRPVPAHLKIDGIEVTDFQEWIALFSETTKEVFAPEAAELVEQAAKRIATSLWLSRSADPFVSPPEWTASGSSNSSKTKNGEPQ